MRVAHHLQRRMAGLRSDQPASTPIRTSWKGSPRTLCHAQPNGTSCATRRRHAPRVESRTHAASSVATSVAAGLPCPLAGRFRIGADEAQQLIQGSKLTLEEFLFSLIKPASQLARPHISGFYVGAVALGGSGAVYVGVNIEFPHSPLNNSIHAEQCLLVNCLHHGERSIKAIAVSAAPCGHCRQFYAELTDADSLEYIFGKDATPKYLKDLLPERFGPADLIQGTPFPLLLEPQSNPEVEWHADAAATVAARSADTAFQRAASEAIAEARQCYAPYTRCYSGAALITGEGAVHSGGYIESAAYNPTLSPFHSAVVDAMTNHLTSYEKIREVVLAERPGAPVVHRANVQLLLDSIAPQAKLTVLPLR